MKYYKYYTFFFYKIKVNRMKQSRLQSNNNLMHSNFIKLNSFFPNTVLNYKFL